MTISSIRIEGGLLGPEILEQLLTDELPGQKPGDFGLPGKRNLTDEIAAIFADARALWGVFQNRLQRLSETDTATSATRDAWVIPFLGLLGYELRFNQKAYDVDGLTFAISHRAYYPASSGKGAKDAHNRPSPSGKGGGGEGDDDAPPVHIVGARQELGRVPPSGRPRLAPHSLVQEYLNRTEHLWGIVTNGLVLRLLRDSTYVRRQAYVEFDLRQIFEDQRFNDFVVLYRLLHRTRLPRGVADAGDCLLEKYYQEGLEQGGRVREQLRDGVKECLSRLAQGFLSHPANDDLRRRASPDYTANDRITPEEFYRQLLVLVYRFLFLLVSEDRGLLSSDPLYREHYGVGRLRRLLDRQSASTEHDDLWCSLRVLWLVLVKDRPQPALNNKPPAAALGLPILNGQLFDRLDLDACRITNRDLLDAFWYLAYYRPEPNAPRRRVNYAALDVEELGSVYESLLDYHPGITSDGRGRLRFDFLAGSERKKTGSYYTPTELVTELIRSALDPVIAERLKAAKTPEEKERALLSIRVCDPACGSGHFLLAAARRLGKELARIRTGEDEPAPERVREAVRDVVSHCIYGVDKNPLAVDLCRVALWLESHTGDKPLTFLDHRIRCGDSLVGVFDLSVLRRGIPDEAFAAVTGDDKGFARSVAKRNREDIQGYRDLIDWSAETAVTEFAHRSQDIDAIADDSPEAVRRKKRLYDQMRHSPSARRQRQACDLWTAAFFQSLRRGADVVITTAALNDRLADRPVDARVLAQAEALAVRHRFFHWPLEFPEVFAAGGFDVVLGNPPWERIKLQEEEFFAARDPRIADAPNKDARSKLIDRLGTCNPALYGEYQEALHSAEATSLFLRHSGRFPKTGRGDINTYAVFAEIMRALPAPTGRAGAVLPTGIATDATTQHFFQDLVDTSALVSLYDFENRDNLFPAVDSRMKFCLLTMTGTARPAHAIEFAFFCRRASDLNDTERRFTLAPEDFRLLNPNTRTAPIFRSRRDAELTKHIYRRVPVLVNEGKGEEGNPWRVQFFRMLDMANDSGLFRTHDELAGQGFRLEGNVFVRGNERYLPLYEAKMIHQFDHRFGDYRDLPPNSKSTQLPEVPLDRLQDPNYRVLPRYWVPEAEVESRLRAKGWDRGWLLGWRDITNVTNERTVIAAVIPRVGVGDKFLLMLPDKPTQGKWLVASCDSYVLDYCARQKVAGTSLKYFTMKQLPFLPPATFGFPCPWSPGETLADFLRSRVLELTYTAGDLEPFARDLGYTGPPFRYDPERRAVLRAELDAAFFHLYLGSPEEWQREAPASLRELFPTPREAVDYILEQFPIVRRHDEERYGEYRTKRMILEIYDAMQESIRTGIPWQSKLTAAGER